DVTDGYGDNLTITLTGNHRPDDSLSVDLVGHSLASCACSVNQVKFYEPMSLRRNQLYDFTKMLTSDTTGQQVPRAGLQDVLDYLSGNPGGVSGGGTFGFDFGTSTFAQADKDYDLSGPSSRTPDLSPTNQSAGNYDNMWQVAFQASRDLDPGGTVTVTAPGAVFPPATKPPASSSTTTADDMYAWVPSYQGCGFWNWATDWSLDSLQNSCPFFDQAVLLDGSKLGYQGLAVPQVQVNGTSKGRVTITVPEGGKITAGQWVTLMVAGVKAPPYTPPPSKDTGNSSPGFTVATSNTNLPAYDGYGTNQGAWWLGFGSLGTVSLPDSDLTVSATSAKVGTASGDGVTATVTLRDALTNPVDNQTVAVADAGPTEGGSPSGAIFVPPSGIPDSSTDPCSDTNVCYFPSTDGNGQATYRVQDADVESVDIMALVHPNTPESDFVPCRPSAASTACKVNLKFTAATPDPAHSRVSVDQPDRPADGTSAATVTVTLLDKYGNPDSGDQVRLEAMSKSQQPKITAADGFSCGNGISSTFACVHQDGTAVFRVSDAQPEAVRLQVDDLTTSMILPTQKSDGTDTDDVAALTFHPVAPDSAKLAAEPTTAPAGADTGSTVSVTLVDDETPAVGMACRVVQLTASGGSSTISPEPVSVPGCRTQPLLANTALTDSQGVARFDVADATAEQVTYTARSVTDNFTLQTVDPGTGATVPQKATVTFAKVSSLIATPRYVVADGLSQAKVTLTWRNSAGDPLARRSVVFDASDGSSLPTATDDNGRATFALSHATAGTVTVTAYDGATGVPIVAGSTGLPLSADVTFLPVPDGAHSTLTATDTDVVADGSSASTVTLVARDANDKPIPHLRVTLTQPPQNASTIAPKGFVTTDDAGGASFTVFDKTVESVTYTARYDGAIDSDASRAPVIAVAVPAKVDFTKPSNEIYDSTITGCPATALVGATGATVEVTLTDADGPVRGHNVVLSAGSPTAAVSYVTDYGVTDGSGKASFRIVDSAAETVTLTAVDVNNGARVDATCALTFQKPPPTDAGKSSVQVAPSSL
ncbi:MAG TPA: Ig-like domain-containing protein, partial [Actinopolymorphaceae bacterium]|nr:Ig-like domain-containing protein [Actinopolymorphaceae bacterium]